MTGLIFCENRLDMATRSVRVTASALIPGDYLASGRTVESVTEDPETGRLIVASRAGPHRYEQRWLPSTPVLISPRP